MSEEMDGGRRPRSGSADGGVRWRGRAAARAAQPGRGDRPPQPRRTNRALSRGQPSGAAGASRWNDGVAARRPRRSGARIAGARRGDRICAYPEFGGLQPVSAAAAADNVAAVLDLLGAGARFLSDENVGADLLNRLAAHGNVKELQALLDCGGQAFDINEPDHRGRTALTAAIAGRHHATVLALLDRGAAVANGDRAPARNGFAGSRRRPRISTTRCAMSGPARRPVLTPMPRTF